jgi:hypothetical protein
MIEHDVIPKRLGHVAELDVRLGFSFVRHEISF